MFGGDGRVFAGRATEGGGGRVWGFLMSDSRRLRKDWIVVVMDS